MDAPSVVAPVEKEIETKGKKVELEVKGYSFSVIRVKL